MKGGWVDRGAVPRGPNGRGICRWCELEVPPRRFTFCSAYCVHEWKMRTQPGYLREQVFLRDRGVCAGCSVDTLAALGQLRRSRGSNRVTLMLHWGMKTRMRRSLWDADTSSQWWRVEASATWGISRRCASDAIGRRRRGCGSGCGA